MKRQKFFTLFAVGLVILAACTRLKTPQEKAGYAVGLSVGQNLTQVKEKVDLGQVFTGFQDKMAGKASIDEAAMAAMLQQLNPQAPVADKAKMGYAVGVSIGMNLARFKDRLDIARVISGMKDQLAGKPKMKPEAMREALAGLIHGESQDYLEQNKKKPGVIVTASGLQYEVVTLGKGKKPLASNTVRVHYRGTLIDGHEFDSSYARKKPAEFPVTGVIPGWVEALQLMPVGSKFHLVIPSELAYGPRGQQGIPPDSMLIFDVELLAIVK